MPKFEVSINEVINHSIQVQAENADQAVKRAREVIINDSNSVSLFTESLGLDQEASFVGEVND
jgi:hypothetical protein